LDEAAEDVVSVDGVGAGARAVAIAVVLVGGVVVEDLAEEVCAG